MRNQEVAELLDRLGELVEANGEDRFKVIAYHRAATSVRNMDEDVEQLWEGKKLEEIQYVGEGIARKIDEYLSTGKLRVMDELQKKTPAGVPLLMKVQGIGPRTAYRLSHELGITSRELNVFLNIFMHWHEADRLPFPHTSTIAKRMGLPLRAVQDIVNSLKTKGLIDKVRERRKDPVRYDVRPLLSKLQPHAKEWMALRGLEVPKAPKVKGVLVDLL